MNGYFLAYAAMLGVLLALAAFVARSLTRRTGTIKRETSRFLRLRVQYAPFAAFVSFVVVFALFGYLFLPTKELTKEETEKKSGPIVVVNFDNNWYAKKALRGSLGGVGALRKLFALPAGFRVHVFQGVKGGNSVGRFAETPDEMFSLGSEAYADKVLGGYAGLLWGEPYLNNDISVFNEDEYGAVAGAPGDIYDYIEVLNILEEVKAYSLGETPKSLRVDVFNVVVSLNTARFAFNNYFSGPGRGSGFAGPSRGALTDNYSVNIVLNGYGGMDGGALAAYDWLLRKVANAEHKVDFTSKWDVYFGMKMAEVRLWLGFMLAGALFALLASLVLDRVRIRM